MKTTSRYPQHRTAAFTLIELLVVIAVIAVLASLIFPITGALKRQRTIKVAQAELQQVQAAIDAYKKKFGTYPPDNPGNPVINPLYYELMGTTNAGVSFFEKGGNSEVRSDGLAAFGVSGFVNVSKGSGDEGVRADTFLVQLRPNQIGQLTALSGSPSPRILVCSVGWDNDDSTAQIVPSTVTTVTRLTPFQYNSSHPTNNPSSYDLWVDVLLKGRTNRISNWNTKPQVLP